MKQLNQVGSAITEFVITLFALVPIFALFTLVGKLSDTQNAAQQGARYQAWEVALTGARNNPANELKLEVHQRVLDTNKFITSVDQEADAVNENPDNRFLWGMSSPTSPGTREALINFEDEGYANNLANQGAGLGAYALSYDVPVLGNVGISELDENGLYNAQINFSINEVSSLEFNGGMNCGNGTHASYFACLSQNNAVLADDWSADSPGAVQRRVKDLNPALPLFEPVVDAIHLIADPPVGIELQLPTPAFDVYKPFKDARSIDEAPGFVLPDIVPRRNLGSYEDEGIEEGLD